MTLTLSSPVQYVPRVGPNFAKKFERLGIYTVRDLLYDAPFRYNDYAHITPIRSLHAGSMASIKGEVTSIKNVFTKNGKKLQQCLIADGSGTATIIWFNQIYLPKIIHAGDMLSVSGMVGFFGNSLVLESPDYEFIVPGKPLLHTGRIVPVYSETAGVSSKWLRSRIYFLLMTLPMNQEYLPEHIRKQYGLPTLEEALHDVHFPKTMEEAIEAKRRLSFDELVFMYARSHEQKRIWQETKHAVSMTVSRDVVDTFIHSLPFALTGDQTTAVQHILTDLEKTTPMNRLLEGDVGSGKTVVAAAAIYAAAKQGLSSVLMAPTQILAEQHYHTIFQLLSAFDIPVALITGASKTKQKEQKTDKPTVLIGTHALLEQSVTFNHVGLVIIDEQQRFGVFQRNVLRTKNQSTITPHLLTMTATPIPRTLALTMYGNLDLSVLHDMPKGRKTIKTWVVPPEKRTSAYTWIEKEIVTQKSQAFILCPFVEESESMTTVKAATKEFEHLKALYPKRTLGLIHGKMKATEKTAALDAFRDGTTDILVATPVVEVGIDIPNATIMMIEASERFGLAQLHQLRGRVGRGNKQSYCLLFSDTQNDDTMKRLKIMEQVQNGPELASYDLKLRGEGDLFGARQHGVSALAMLALGDDVLLKQAKQTLDTCISLDPTFHSFPPLRERLDESKIQNIAQD